MPLLVASQVVLSLQLPFAVIGSAPASSRLTRPPPRESDGRLTDAIRRVVLTPKGIIRASGVDGSPRTDEGPAARAQ